MALTIGNGITFGGGISVITETEVVSGRYLWAWGDGEWGTLGNNTDIDASSPIQVGALSTWSTVSVGSGGSSILGILTDGTLWSWGRNYAGTLGQGDTINRSSPVQVGSLTTWLSVAAGYYSTFATKTTGTLWSWGGNGYGQLGQGNIISRSSPTQIGALTTWSSFSSTSKIGPTKSMTASKTDGTLWSWGFNSYGELGLNDIDYRSSPVQIGSLTTWSSSVTIPCTIKTDGTLWSWGYNGSGQLGLGDAIDRSSPVQIGSLTTWSVYSGIPGYTGFTHSSSLALKTDGTIWAWGNNTYGQLGLGDTINRSSPVQVGSLTTWSIIALGGSKGGSDGVRASAIKTDGTLWIWGSNSFGSLGLNNTINRSSPVQVGALTTWLQLSVGSAVMAAIKS